MLEISEIFHSIQGEGPFIGQPGLFVRLSGCKKPLCPWCDTSYANGPGRLMSVSDVLKSVFAFKNPLIIITGGEPFLQWDRGLKDMVKILQEKSYNIQYETSGKIMIPVETMGTVVCSPKYIREKWEFIPKNIDRSHYFKFVIYDEFESVIAFIDKYDIPNQKVWIMPLGETREKQLSLLPSVWAFCQKNRFNFSPRLHIITFDNQRGK